MIAELLASASLLGSAQSIPGDVVTLGVRTERRGLVRVYLVLVDATRVRSALDRRLHYIGSTRPRNGRAIVSFRVPPFGGAFRAWCAGCGTGGRLQVTMPPVTVSTCPVTIEQSGPPPALDGIWHGNDALWTHLPDEGVLVARTQDVRADGSIWTKRFWYGAGFDGTFTLSGRRLDGESRQLQVHAVNRGLQSGYRGPTWATPISFPTQGCWRLTARIANLTSAVSLSFVMKVVSA